MSDQNQLKKHTRRFLRTSRGNVAIIFSMLLLPLFTILGALIDQGSANLVRQRALDALDAATLNAALAISNGTMTADAAEDKARQIFAANLAAAGYGDLKVSDLNFDLDAKSGVVNSDVKVELQTAFLSIIGIDVMTIGGTSQALAKGKDVELAVMLDVTGSMSGKKITSLKSASHKLIDTLLPEGGGSPLTKVRIGLVPYAQSVNVGAYAKTVTAGKGKKCVTERKSGQAYTDASYFSDPLLAESKKCPKQKIVPLTDNRATLKGRIDKLKTGGSTAGHLGIAWSWYMLSPSWSPLWPQSAPVAYNDPDTLKVSVLMTDGSFNTSYNGTKSPAQARYLCDNMKAPTAGIVIYAVAFKAPNDAAALLNDCATSAQHYYDAANESELEEAFETIAMEIRDLRLSK